MLRGVFVTGTDTNVGKTVVSAALLHRYGCQASVRYWKPIQTGIERDDDTAEVHRLGGCSRGDFLPPSVRLPCPVSPHLAAKWAGKTIDLQRLVGWTIDYAGPHRWLVEGAGGVLVPINDSETMVDLMLLLALPVVVVVRTSLGTINHTLLTLEALRKRSLQVAGVVMVGDADDDNRAAIEHYGSVPILGVLPRFDCVTSEAVGQWAVSSLDPQNLLWKFFNE